MDDGWDDILGSRRPHVDFGAPCDVVGTECVIEVGVFEQVSGGLEGDSIGVDSMQVGQEQGGAF